MPKRYQLVNILHTSTVERTRLDTDFWRRDAPVTHTPGTLQEDDLVLKKCIEENSNLGFYSEAWTLSLVIDFWRRDAPTDYEALKSICRILGPRANNPTLGVQHAVAAGYKKQCF